MGFKVSGGTGGKWFYGVLILLGIVLVIGGCAAAQRLTLKTQTVKIQDKAIKRECSSNHDCHDTYMIYTDKGVYKDKDNLFFLKFNSSDLYGQLQRGHTYECRSNGFRVPLFSHYRNMLDCKDAG